MSKVASDLESLIQFREHLKSFNHVLQDEFTGMRSHWQELGDVWNDTKYSEFGAALDEVSRGIDRYLVLSDDFENHLHRLIDTLREYLDTRM